MDLSTLKPAEGSVRNNKRLGRGQGSGTGGTAGKGHKGAKSRSGNTKKRGFEGGQMPLQRRLPKFGFTNINRVEYKAINLGRIQELAESNNITEINVETLVAFGLISKNDLVKVLAKGEIKAKVNVLAHAFSQKALEAIEAVGGTIAKV
jgi:large subunit ribosomal protein L15